MNFFKQLLECVEQRLVILGSKHLPRGRIFIYKLIRVPFTSPMNETKLTLVTNVPPGLRNSLASFKALNVSSACEKASCNQADPTFGEPSFKTQSAFHVFSSFCRSCICKKLAYSYF